MSHIPRLLIIATCAGGLLYGAYLSCHSAFHSPAPPACSSGITSNTAPLNSSISPGELPPAPYPADLAERAAQVPGMTLSLGTTAELPPELDWQDGLGQPEIGDPAAHKGGTVRLSNVGPFPANFLAFGSPSPQFFHYNCFTTIELPLVAQHPITGGPMPGVAQAWACHGTQLYYRLDPDARYSNGRPVRAADYLLGILLRAELSTRGTEAGDVTSAASEINTLREHITGLRALDDHHLCITLRHPAHELSPCSIASMLHPAEPGFYAEFGQDYATRYQHRIPPTTGAYTIGNIQRGRLITLEKVPHWWAAEKPYRRFTCNVDRIEHHFLTDEAQAWEFFLRGKLDIMQTRHTAAWLSKLDTPDVHQGRIERHTFKADYPMPPYGIALNALRLPDLELRRGILCALDMPQAIRILFMGEGEQLSTFTTGYGLLSPSSTPTTNFDPTSARAHFARAGYIETGSDGILRKPDGTRLSLRLTYVPSDKLSTLAGILIQSARACGAEILPDAVPWQLSANRLQNKQHDLLFWACMPTTPLPDYRRYFSSESTGFDAPFCLQEPAMDTAIAAYEAAGNLHERAAACAHIDQLIAQLAIWLPGWKENLVHLACWRNVRFPQTRDCSFSTPAPYDVMEAHLYWIDPSYSTSGSYPEVDAHHTTVKPGDVPSTPLPPTSTHAPAP